MKLDRTTLDATRVGSHLGVRRVAQLRAARPLWLSRLSFWGPVTGFTAAGTLLAASLTAGTTGWLRWPLLVLVGLNLLYFAVTGWPGVLGLLVRGARRELRAAASPSGRSRTAVLMPVHNEVVAPVFAAVEVMARAAAQAGLGGLDFFVLSDTRDPGIAAEEEEAYAALRARAVSGPGVFYRRRATNERRKVGNIAQFCAEHGASYDYMVVLDADSLMSVDALRRLVGLMDANPGVGIVQTVPYPVGRDTLFARLQQFAARLYTPLLVDGLTFWQQADCNYWGHNAIIRIRPFVEHCDMPVLPGREPFGGEILCHDVVEAGLMRRAGWDVWVLPDNLGSYEALPANMVDYAGRERRWCQGNLQHLGVIGYPGLRPVGRYHLGVGVAHYLAGPLAAAFVALATLDAALGGNFAAALFLGHGPGWWGLLGLTGFLLYGAKLAALGSVLADGDAARSYGGRTRLLASAALEQLSAFLTAPVLILFYTRCVAVLLLGRSVRWDAQARDDRGVSGREALRFSAWMAVLGAGWAAALAALDPGLLGWASPMIAGLLLAAPYAVLTSRAEIGRLFRRYGLLLTPDETAPVPILRAFRVLMGIEPVTAARPVPQPTRVLPLGLTVKAGESD